jgi:hypothetical protein
MNRLSEYNFDLSESEDRTLFQKRYVQADEMWCRENGLPPLVQGSRYLSFIEEVLRVDLSEVQSEIVTSVESEERLAVQSGNAYGKSFTLACLSLAWQYCNENALTLVVSGNYAQIEDGYWGALSGLHKELQSNHRAFPGRITNSRGDLQLKIDEFPEHTLRAVSPRDPSSVEGKHSENALIIIEEADKEAITEQVVSSAISSVTNSNDRVLMVGNPPEPSHPFYDKLSNPRWTTKQYSAFDSRNLQRALGNTDKPSIDGLVDVSRVRDVWESHDEEWPGIEQVAQYSKDVRDDLSRDWYRLIMGETPPESAGGLRPLDKTAITEACERWTRPPESPTYDALGVDLATDGDDKTVIIGVTDSRADVLASFDGPVKESKKRVENLSKMVSGPVVVDVVNESSFEELLDVRIERFKGSTKPADEETYRNKRAQSYGELGDWLDEGGSVKPNSDLSEELYASARALSYEVKELRTSETLLLSPKEQVKQILGNSPDHADALSYAVYGLRAESQTRVIGENVSAKDLF